MYALLSGVQVHYEILGNGEPILLAHGWGGSSASLLPLGKILSTTNKVILVDLPGFGKSENPKENWGVEEYSDILIELLESLKIKKVIYFGHSFGGSLGIILTATKNRLITKLILCNSAYKRVKNTSLVVRLYKHIFPGDNPPFRRLLYNIFFRGSDLARFPKLEKNLRLIAQTDLTEHTKDIKTKTLIIWGEGDSITPVAWAHELHENIKDSVLKIIPNTRHGLPLRNPDIVADEVLKFIYS